MTKNELIKVMARVENLLQQHNKAVIASAVRKLSSGGVDPEQYDLTDYSLPKVLFTSALHDHKDDFHPLYGPHQKDTMDLNNF